MIRRKSASRNYGNAIYPKAFEGDPDDRELLLLAAYLETMRHQTNVRKIEKRRWRETAYQILG